MCGGAGAGDPVACVNRGGWLAHRGRWHIPSPVRTRWRNLGPVPIGVPVKQLVMQLPFWITFVQIRPFWGLIFVGSAAIITAHPTAGYMSITP